MTLYSATSATEAGKLAPLPIAASISRESAIKWLLIAFVGLLDWIWMAVAGFQIDSGVLHSLGWISLLILISIFYRYTGRDQRIMAFAHFGAQYLALFAVLMPLSYLAVSTDAPLADPAFDAIDKALGLDWASWSQWVLAHRVIRLGLSIAYGSLPFQALFCYIYNVHTRAPWRNSEIWWISFISALVTIGISSLVPAVSGWVYYGFAGMNDFPHMQQFHATRAGTLHVIGFTDAQGLVQLPSFHTVLAIMLTYNLRHNRWLFSCALLLNTAVILSCPTEGGHYFIDLIAGAVVAAATIWAVRAMQRRFFARLGLGDMVKPLPAMTERCWQDDAV